MNILIVKEKKEKKTNKQNIDLTYKYIFIKIVILVFTIKILYCV